MLLAAACSAPPDIRTVGFKNFSYSADCLADEGAEKITTSIGRFEHAVDSLRTGSFEVRDIAYGDVTDDGSDEAAAVTACSGDGSASKSS